MKNATLLTCSLILAASAFAQNSEISFTVQPQAETYTPQGGSFSVDFSITSADTPTVNYITGNPLFDFSVSSTSSETININGERRYKWGYSGARATVGTTHQYTLRAATIGTAIESNPFRITMVSGLLTVAENLGDGYFQSNPLGLIYAAATPWLYQDQGLGWIAPDADATAISAWLYSPLADIGWLYYQAFQYPWMYSTEQDSWVYFVYQNNARAFFVQRTGQWIVR